MPVGGCGARDAVRMTTIIRATDASDLLALVPALAGFVPERSIVCVAFRGSRSAGVLRHDLPRRARDRPALVSAIIGTLCRMPGVDAVVPIAYTDTTFAAARGMPERGLLSLLVRRAAQAGFDVRDALCRAADGWGSLLDPDPPAAGHPLEAIDESSAARRLPAEALPSASPAEAGRLPAVDEATADALRAELEAFADLERSVAQFERLDHASDPVALIEALLVGEPAELPALRLAWFLHLADRPAIRDAMMLQLAFGPQIGELAHDDAAATASRAAASRGDASMNWCGASSPRARRTTCPNSSAGCCSARRASGPTIGAFAVPSTSFAGPPPTHPATSARDRCAWRRGWRGRSAWGRPPGCSSTRPSRSAPGHSMATLLSAFIGSGALPEWAFVDPAGDVSDR